MEHFFSFLMVHRHHVEQQLDWYIIDLIHRLEANVEVPIRFLADKLKSRFEDVASHR